ncbi:MAG TPA: (2Fe-2S)-binding protein [Anaeromyxobacteraceae bacterium]|nr:(2Fe-2S)-binding protein [Anaeromyxobacteraceae bacterium]
MCRGVSDRQLREAVRAGKTLDDVMRTTGAGTDCGSCLPAMARIAAAARAEGVAIAMKAADAARDAA